MITLTTSKYILPLIPNVQSMHQRFIKRAISKKSDKIKKLMKEYKSVFGELVETNAEKKRRLKLEKKGKIPQQKPNTTDAELSWVMKNSGNNLKKIPSSMKPQNELVDPHKSSNVKIKNPNDQNIEPSFHSEIHSNPVLHKVDLKITNPSCNLSTITDIGRNENTSNLSSTENTDPKYDVPSNFERLPDIIIKNLPSFPIMGSKQKSLAHLTEVLSISGQDDPETIKFPSVTKILTQTMPLESKLALEAWKKRMIEKLGLEGFEMHQKALLEDGSALHSCIAQSLLRKEYEVPLRIEPVFKSVQNVLEDVHHVKAIETHVAHNKLRYKGVVDCIASYRGENYLIDWKKSDKKKLNLKSTYDAPVQIAAYIGAINASNLYPFVIKHGLLVIAYTCGAPATVYEVCDNTLQQYWTMWLRRLQDYYFERTSNDDNKSYGQ
ncbi:mitochondrial genome maintenance exonuclease 1 [Anoplolepis gracilipes]|uniref:mitochondrial genome maintenance exonuclease 1 n=1 Tax=Anoplolepis gracilipes TaxID=354296 RepID=UPI003BA17E6C